MLAPATAVALHALAGLTGANPTGLARALPAFGTTDMHGPFRATTACHKCTARRGIHRPVPVFLPIHDKVCTRHGVWFGDFQQPHLDVSACPEIIEAQHQVDRLLRSLTPQQLTLAHQAASSALPAWPASPAAISFHWRHRLLVLQTTNHPRGISDDHGSYTPAAIYPDAIRLTVLILKPHHADQHEQDPMAESARPEDVSRP